MCGKGAPAREGEGGSEERFKAVETYRARNSRRKRLKAGTLKKKRETERKKRKRKSGRREENGEEEEEGIRRKGKANRR